LATSVHPQRHRHRALVLLKAYFDESGVHRGSQTALIAGFVGTLPDWESLEARWNEILQEARIPYFHSTEMESGRLLGSDRPEIREYVKQQLADAVTERNLQSVVCAVDTADWADVTPLHPEFTSVFPKPYNFCHEVVAQQVATWSEANANSEPVALVFAEYNEFRPHVDQVYDAYRSNPIWANAFSSITFAQMKRLPPLQAADMLAYDHYQRICHIRHVAERYQTNDPNRRMLLTLMRAGKRPIGSIFTAEALREVVARGSATRFGVFPRA
jgi:hypothetical protein